MESLALLTLIIVSPALYGGPMALILTLWRRAEMTRARKVTIRVLSALALISGTFLVVTQVNSGAKVVGLSGLLTAILALWRIK